MSCFDRIIGYEPIKEELLQIVDMCKNFELYEKVGATLPKGILIYGAPGVGKTTLANAFIDESGLKSFVIKKAGSKNKVIDNIINTFENAKKEEKCVILIDDIDKFCEDNGREIDDGTFMTIQSCIDDVKNNQTIVIATANSLTKLPKSLIRKGRFDRRIRISTPRGQDAKDIIEYYLKRTKVDSSLNVNDIINMISYISSADLESIINDAAIIATYKRKEKIEMDDFVTAYLKTEYHCSNFSFTKNEEALEEAIHHEAGHAAMAEIIKKGSVGLISVQYTGMYYGEGLTRFCETFDRRVDQTLISLAGKVAVETFFKGRCASGCQSDIDNAFALLRQGLLENGTHGYSGIKQDEKTSDVYKQNVEAMVIGSMERHAFIVKDLLLKNKELYFAIVNKLREKKYLLYSDIQKIEENMEMHTNEIYY